MVLATSATASEVRPTLAELENELICPTCNTTLALSNSPIAERMRTFIRGRIAAGDTKGEIKDALVAQFGEAVLAAPPAKGFNLVVWVLPFAGLAAAAAVVFAIARRWARASRARATAAPATGGAPTALLDPELERRLDEELRRFDAE